MKYSLKLFSYLALITLFTLHTYGQRMPEQMQLSEDGHRLTTGGTVSEGFYNEAEIPIIYIEFPQNNWESILDQNYEDKITIPATVTIGDEVFMDAGVRYKGQTSYFQNNTNKKSFAISLNETVDGQDIEGYNTLNLQCGWLDPSYIRETLYLNTNREHIPSAKGNFVRVFVNGTDRGIYGNVQQLNNDFLKEWFMTNDGSLWRCEDPNSTAGPGGGGPGGGGPGGGGPGGGGPGGGGAQFGAGTSSINYLGTNLDEYENAYTLKSSTIDDPWTPLMESTNILENTPNNQLEEALKGYLNVDRTLWFLAHEIMFSDDDGYVFKGGMDYFLYWEPETNEIVPLEYDGNTCMETANDDWSVFYREDDENFPLCNKLFNVPALRQRYLAHVRTMLEEQFNPTVMDAKIDAYHDLLDDEIANDPLSIYGYNQFNNGIEELKEFVEDRYDFYYNNSEVNRPYLEISNVAFASDDKAGVDPMPGETVKVTAEVGGTPAIGEVSVYYATGFVGSFDKMQMTSNGGVFEATLPDFPAGTYVRYYVEAEANDGVGTLSFFPKGAEHDVFLYRVQASPSTTIAINELMASNDAAQSDEAGEFDDWVELYNLTDQDFDISGYSLSDNYTIPYRWQFAEGTSIGPNEYLIVWIDDDGTQGPLHTSYNLSSKGEQVILSDASGAVVDEVTYGEQETDMAYARIPNGTGEFIVETPTFSAHNEGGTGLADINIGQIAMYPNPAAHSLNVILEQEATEEGDLSLIAFDLAGRSLYETGLNQTNTSIPVADWAAGTYAFTIYKDGAKVQTIKVAIFR